MADPLLLQIYSYKFNSRLLLFLHKVLSLSSWSQKRYNETTPKYVTYSTKSNYRADIKLYTVLVSNLISATIIRARYKGRFCASNLSYKKGLDSTQLIPLSCRDEISSTRAAASPKPALFVQNLCNLII